MSFLPFKVHFSPAAAAACRLQMNEAGLCDQWQDEQEAGQRYRLVSWLGGARLVEVAAIFRGTPIIGQDAQCLIAKLITTGQIV